MTEILEKRTRIALFFPEYAGYPSFRAGGTGESWSCGVSIGVLVPRALLNQRSTRGVSIRVLVPRALLNQRSSCGVSIRVLVPRALLNQRHRSARAR